MWWDMFGVRRLFLLIAVYGVYCSVICLIFPALSVICLYLLGIDYVFQIKIMHLFVCFCVLFSACFEEVGTMCCLLFIRYVLGISQKGTMSF